MLFVQSLNYYLKYDKFIPSFKIGYSSTFLQHSEFKTMKFNFVENLLVEWLEEQALVFLAKVGCCSRDPLVLGVVVEGATHFFHFVAGEDQLEAWVAFVGPWGEEGQA
jgi:hypothetical protein